MFFFTRAAPSTILAVVLTCPWPTISVAESTAAPIIAANSQIFDGGQQVPLSPSYMEAEPTCLPYNNKVSLRYPPSIDDNTRTWPAWTAWTAFPPAWLFGNWKVRYSSQPVYRALYNFQSDTYPVLPTDGSDPPGRQYDVVSFSAVADATDATLGPVVVTAFGYDTPLPHVAPGVYRFHGSGALAHVTNTWEVLAWGYDSDAVAWRLEYETAHSGGVPNFNILSREETGPSPRTLAAIFDAMEHLFHDDADLLALARNLTALPLDGRRTGLPPVACDEACMLNTALEAYMAGSLGQ